MCSNAVLLKLIQLCNKWKDIGMMFGLLASEIQEIEHNFITANERMVRMLEKWALREGSTATYQKLVEALLRLGETELAVEVCRAIKAVSSGL